MLDVEDPEKEKKAVKSVETDLDIKEYLKASKFFQRIIKNLISMKLGSKEQDELKLYFK